MRALSVIGSFVCLALCLSPQVQAEPTRFLVDLPREPLSEKDGLKIYVAPTSKGYNGVKTIRLQPGAPHINIVLQNTSARPLNVYDEWNSWGADCVTLEITRVDGEVLEKPLGVSNAQMIWRANAPTTEVIEPGEAIVRELRLHLPAQIFNPDAPVTHLDRDPMGAVYVGLPLPEKKAERQVTMRAVFKNSVASKEKEVWTGYIAGSSADYCIYWDLRVQ